LAVLLGGDELRIYTLRADLELHSLLLEQSERFHRDHILARVPPPVDGSWSCSEWLRARYPIDRAPVMRADAETERIGRELLAARAAKDTAEAREYAARNALISIMGEAAEVEGDGWRVSYKTTKGRPVIDWDAIAAEAKVPTALIEKHTKRTPFRMFRVTERK
jgi:predicted phage-related endonuclease